MLSLPKVLSILLLLCISNCISGQKELIKTYYKDGRLESKGWTYKYSSFYDVKRLKKMDNKFTMIQKKIKQWKYWYNNGELRRIENYKLVIDKNYFDLPDGKWVYFNEGGTKYREEIYKDGEIIKTTKDIFQNSKLVGKITINTGNSDTTLFVPFTKGNNLIINPDFDFFYYKSVLITYHGDTPIEDWIPFWTTPGPYTPDFVSNLRYIDVFSYSYMFDMPLPNEFQYTGIALYKESDIYSEYIQGKIISPLIKGKMYCLRTSINLCSYSKYTVNRLSFYLSTSPIKVDSTNEVSFSPQLSFSELPAENKHFITLCDYFTADGGEKYITVGRFTKPEYMEIKKRSNIPVGLFGLERAAYYLIDDIQLFEIKDSLECHCRMNSIDRAGLKDKPEGSYETDLNKLRQGVPVLLENVNFEFDSFILLKSSDIILNTLLKYLNKNPEVKINIEGHTDDIGTEDYNLDLSTNRAKSVYNWLINKGIDSSRLNFTGFGKSRPISNDTEEKHRALNRRVEVRILEN